MWGSPAAVVAICVGLKAFWPTVPVDAAGPQQPGQVPQRPVANAAAPQQLPVNTPAGPAKQGQLAADPQAKIVANVNGEEITRVELAQACMIRFGKPVMESLINKQLISQYCAQQKIQITPQDLTVEVDRLARKFRMTSEEYLKMLKQERGISPEQYTSEIVWTTLALRRLAAQTITPSDDEIAQAFESQYGEAVKTRIIVLNDEQQAQQVCQAARQNPDDFGSLARKHSQDPSASVGGLIPPLRRYMGEPALEKAAFALNETDRAVSNVIPLKIVGDPQTPGTRQFAILKFEGLMKPMQVEREQVKAMLRDGIVEKKIREEAAKIFTQLESRAQQQKAIVNVYNDPQLRNKYPGVAAQVYQKQIRIDELSEECVSRHGIQVLEALVSKRLLQQALKTRNIQVTQDDLDGEVAKAALLMGVKNAQGGPDIEAWLNKVVTEEGVSVKTYLDDSVWPSVALAKLAGQVQITEEDLKNGYEANYGSRVKCRAIVMINLRKAQEVWEEARRTPTVETFGKLAETHSADPASKALQGKIPPIQKHGGQKMIEAEAFKLQPNELSGIINIGENYVILFCEGYTQPTQAPFAEVRQGIHDDIHEKKQRNQMSQAYLAMQENARIDNYLAGTTHYPTKKAAHQKPAAGSVIDIPTAREANAGPAKGAAAAPQQKVPRR